MRRPTSRPGRSIDGEAYDRATLHAFMFTLTLATAVTLAYGPSAALHHIEDVLSAAGSLSADPDAWQTALAD